MVVSDKIIEEIKTSDGHTGYFSFLESPKTMTRIEFIIDSIKALNTENIVHVGCCGHLDKIQQQIKNKKHLHSELLLKFDNVLGFDIDNNAIEFLRSRDVKNIYCIDFLDAQATAPILKEKFGDERFVILLPDIIEHLENPIDFLRKLKSEYRKYCNNLIISVPNVYSYQRISRLYNERAEAINLDHKYMFTPVTILKVLIQAGVKPRTLDFLGFFDDYPLINKLSLMGHTIILSCDL